jgi:hypothetical protein
MAKTADRLAALERRLMPPRPGPQPIYVEPTEIMATAERLAAPGASVSAVMPRVMPEAEWEKYATAQQAESQANAAANIRERIGQSGPTVPDGVLPMTR